MRNQTKTKDELEKEKLDYEIKCLKRWWIHPSFLSGMGLLVVIFTAVSTNVTEFFKVKSIEAREKQANQKLDSTQRILHFTIDSLNKLHKAFNKGNMLMTSYKKRIKIAVDTIKNKDILISYLRNQLDLLMQYKVLNKELRGSCSDSFSNDYDNGFILTTDDGQPIILNETGKALLDESGKPILNEKGKQ